MSILASFVKKENKKADPAGPASDMPLFSPISASQKTISFSKNALSALSKVPA
jgi:hypothetical protein